MPGSLSTALIMFVFLALLFSGLPIAFCAIGVSCLFLLLVFGPGMLSVAIAATLSQIKQEAFIAVPLFVFMAAILQFSGVAGHLYNAMHKWMGPIRGGLAIGTVAICTIIGALTGIGATATVMMGLIGLPEMRRLGYDKRLAVGAITAGGTLGPLIPPSILMIVIGTWTGLSVGKLFLGGVIPGLIISFSWMLYIAVKCAIHPNLGPALPIHLRGTMLEKVTSLRYVIMPILLVVVILGAIYTGICTPTEASSVGVVGAAACAAINRQFTWENMKGAVYTTFRTTGLVMWMVIGGGTLSSVLTASGSTDFVRDMLAGLALPHLGFLIMMLLISLIMGCFIDPIAIIMICVPIFVPMMASLGIDPFYGMLLLTVSLVIGYLTPPFGGNLFYMRGVAPDDVSMKDIYKAVLPYIYLMLICLALCLVFPQILTWLPNKMIK